MDSIIHRVSRRNVLLTFCLALGALNVWVLICYSKKVPNSYQLSSELPRFHPPTTRFVVLRLSIHSRLITSRRSKFKNEFQKPAQIRLWKTPHSGQGNRRSREQRFRVYFFPGSSFGYWEVSYYGVSYFGFIGSVYIKFRWESKKRWSIPRIPVISDAAFKHFKEKHPYFVNIVEDIQHRNISSLVSEWILWD